MRNFLNSTIVNQMQYFREHAVVTNNRDNTIIYDKIAIKVKELNSKFHLILAERQGSELWS